MSTCDELLRVKNDWFTDTWQYKLLTFNDSRRDWSNWKWKHWRNERYFHRSIPIFIRFIILGQITNLQEYIRCKTLLGSSVYVVHEVVLIRNRMVPDWSYINSWDQNIYDFPPNPPDMNYCSYEMNNEKPCFQRPYKNFTKPYPYPDP